MSGPRVSVVITNYNYAHYLPHAIDSALAQTYPHVEIVVVDDGSTDDSEAVHRRYAGRIRWIAQANQGVAAARNRGVAASRGELVAFLDADDLWLPPKLERQVRRFVAEPALGLVYCGLQEIRDDGRPGDARVEGLEGSIAQNMLLLDARVLTAPSTVMVPRATFDAAGGFDRALSTSADCDFFYRVAVGQPVGFVPEALVRYRIHASNMHGNIRAMEHDMLRMYGKAFASAAYPRSVRRRSYGNLHMVLAGSFFRAGQLRDFVRHAVHSLVLTPSNGLRLVGFPRRLWERTRQRLAPSA